MKLPVRIGTIVRNDGSIAIIDGDDKPICYVSYRGDAEPEVRWNAPSDERDANARAIVNALNGGCANPIAAHEPAMRKIRPGGG